MVADAGDQQGSAPGIPRVPQHKFERPGQICTVVIYWLVVWNMAFMTFHIFGLAIPTD